MIPLDCDSSIGKSVASASKELGHLCSGVPVAAQIRIAIDEYLKKRKQR